MINLISNLIKKIQDTLSSNGSAATIWLWHDRVGSGKSFIAKKFCENKNNTYYCDSGSVEDLERKFKISKLFARKVRDLDDKIFNFIQKNKISEVIFDIGSNNCSNQFYEIIQRALTRLMQIGYAINSIFIFDAKDELLRVTSYFENYFNVGTIQYLPLEIFWQKDDLKELVCENYGNLFIDDERFCKLVKYSANNAGLFLKQIQNLKYLKVIERTTGSYVWSDEDIEPYLIEMYDDNIEKRYNNLEPRSKNILLKSSVIGDQFSVKMLQNAFRVSDAITVLKNVQIASRLIEFTDSSFTNGKFESDNVRDFLRKSIPLNDYKETCKQLAYYYTSLINKYHILSFERIELYQKCSFYEFESGECESAYIFAFGALELMYTNRLYSSAIAYGNEIANFNMGTDLDLLLYRFLYETANKILDYSQAFNFYEKYLKLNKAGNSFEEKYKLGELYYNTGQAKISLKILIALKDDKSTMALATNEQKARLFNFLSSVEETLDIDEYKTHFNEALNLAQSNRQTALYFKLLRKSNFIYHNEQGLAYITKAKEFFETTDKLEYALCCHNLATEQLLLSLDYAESAKRNLDEAVKNMVELDCRQITYVYNSYAIYYMMKGRYQEACDCLLPQFNLKQEDFTLLALHLNLCTCFRRLGKTEAAIEQLTIAREINKKSINGFHFFTTCILMQDFMFCLENNNISAAEQIYCEVKEPAKGYSLLKTMEYALGKEQNYDSVSKHCGSNKLVLCDLMFWE